jgi:hypothetical protein
LLVLKARLLHGEAVECMWHPEICLLHVLLLLLLLWVDAWAHHCHSQQQQEVQVPCQTKQQPSWLWLPATL